MESNDVHVSGSVHCCSSAVVIAKTVSSILAVENRRGMAQYEVIGSAAYRLSWVSRVASLEKRRYRWERGGAGHLAVVQ
jgi:hypothetical protein